jgi:GTPase SAR1 family protein
MNTSPKEKTIMTQIVTGTSGQLSDFLERRKALVALLERLQSVLHMLNMTAWQQKMQQLEQRATTDNFKVLVMGEFKRGKSTFINALLGQEVLPAYATPTTAIINEVKWGEQPRAVLHFRPSKDGSVRAPQDIPVDRIEEYVTIRDEQPGYSAQSVLYENPYEKVELFWPLDLCRDGVEIIDSPGLNEDIERQKITLEYLTTIDAAIFVIACDFPVAISEQAAISSIKEANHETVFFVCNRFNLIRRPEDRERVKERCLKLLAPLTKQGARHVFFIDALGALQGRLQGNAELLNQSQLLPVEEELKTFLVKEKGRIKLMRPATGMKNAIREARLAIPQQQKLLQMNLETLQERYEQAQQGLDKLEQERREIIAYLSSARAGLRGEVNSAAVRFYSDIANSVDGWLQAYNIQKPMGLHEVFSGKARERVVEEVAEFLTDRVSSLFKEWQTTTLEPLVASHAAAIEQDLSDRTRHFAFGLEEVRTELVTDPSLALSTDAARQEQVSGKERLAAGAAGALFGVLTGDPTLAIMGGMFGFKEMLINIAPQIAVIVATAVIFGPALVIPAALGAGLIRGLFKANAINKKIRDAVGQEYKQKLLETHLDLAAQLAKAVDKKLAQAQGELDQALGLELQNVRDQVQAVIREKTQGQAKVDQVLRTLTQASDELNGIDHDLDALIEQIALA